MVTLTVFPTVKSLTFPTFTQFLGLFRKRGAITKPITGTAKTAVQTPANERQSFSKNPRRLIAAGSSRCLEREGRVELSVVFMTNLGNPSSKRSREQSKADDDSNERGDQAPENKR
jgi:hypothetical protein